MTRIGIDARMFSDAFTGIGRYTFELTQRFFKMRPDWDFVLFMNAPQFDQFCFPDNVKKVLVDAPHYSLSEQTSFLKALNKEACDLVHFPHFNVPLLYTGDAVVTIHDLTLSLYPGRKAKWLHRQAYKLVLGTAVSRAKAIITVSHNTQTDLELLQGTPREKITTIWNGIDHPAPLSDAGKRGLMQQFNLPQEYLFYAGNWRGHKNLARLIEAFAVIKKDYPELRLIMTGNPDPLYPEAQDLIKTHSLETSVITPGYVSAEQLEALYRGATAFVFPSLYEGFGIPPLEAMAVGTPTVVSNAGSIPEVCGDATIYIDPLSTESLIGGLRDVLETDMQPIIEKGYARSQIFNWDIAAEKTIGVYERALN